MIIKASNTKGRWAFQWAYLLVPLLFAALWFLPSLLKHTQGPSDPLVLCDAEHVEGRDFITQGNVSGNGVTQSSDRSYSGKFSSKLDTANKYGMTITIPTLPQNLRYIVSIQRWTSDPKNLSALSVSGNKGSKFSLQTSAASDRDERGWELLKLEFTLPKDREVTSLTIFPYTFGNDVTAYFDDLRLETIDLDTLSYAALPRLHFYLDNKAIKKLEAKRAAALELGILKTGDDDWVKAKLTIDDEEAPTEVKLRLKGDWTDHLKGDYWSYRVQMPSERSWNRMQTFSLQDPVTRFYLHEWLYHKALESVDILTPRYGFVLLKENTKKQVLYAYEEHFEKQIAEFKNRREGVIVKFAEDSFWDQLIRNREVHEEHGHRVALPTAEVVPFKASKTASDPKLREQFIHASKLLNAYRDHSAPATEIFDVERLARYMAITDIFEAHHGTVWSNLRFYYNPITRKLEPIGFDGFTELGPMKGPDKLFSGEFKSGKIGKKDNSVFFSIFQDEEFSGLYTSALLEYSSHNFITKLYDDHFNEIYGNESQIITYIDEDYQFDLTEIKQRSRLIHNDIIPYQNTSLKVYLELDKNGESTFWATNHHSLPLETFGGSRKSGGDILDAEVTFVGSNRRGYPKSFTEISLPKDSKYACYRLPGLDSTFYTQVYKWQRPSSNLKVLYSNASDPKIPLPQGAFMEDNKNITILSGKYDISSPMIIPANYTLTLEAGTELNFTEKSYLLSYGTLHCKGIKGSPILFTSSDRSAQGVTVIQADKTSELSYTTFSNLNTLEENEWQLTGAVTFYESDVQFNVVTVSHNLCEDALNLVRSKFEISGLNINHTFADGFDGDFCRGTLRDSYFYMTGNDGLDFSGSWVNVSNTTLDQIGDKGISAGEEAHLTISDVRISNAQIGIASKDLSEVTVRKTTLKNCLQGFAAYRKKPEFGGGRITVESYEAENVKRTYNSDAESTITLPK